MNNKKKKTTYLKTSFFIQASVSLIEPLRSTPGPQHRRGQLCHEDWHFSMLQVSLFIVHILFKGMVKCYTT